MTTASTSRIPGFYKLELEARLAHLTEAGIVDAEERALLLGGTGGLMPHKANYHAENVIGTLAMPLGLGLNFIVNGREVLVPMAIEEPSVVAAVSNMANCARGTGGFFAEADDPVMIGQVQIVDIDDDAAAARALHAARDRLLAEGNALVPKLVERGGGVRDIEVRSLHERADPESQPMLVLHLFIDVRDAMGANLVNTVAEGLANTVEEITGGRVLLRILSNLADRRLARAQVTYAASALDENEGPELIRNIELASRFAELDPYRAATHNKGIFNGIDAVALATGNDWRAIEAGGHAWAARDGRYTALATWRVRDGDRLEGRIELPLAVGTVGSQIESHPTVRLAHKILGVSGAAELAGIMAAVGLAQNLGALRALAWEGIQQGHMTLHARNVAVAAGAAPDEIAAVVAELQKNPKEAKVWRAKEILEGIRGK